MSVPEEDTSVTTDVTTHIVTITAAALKVMTLTLMEEPALVGKQLVLNHYFPESI